ncbi:hypothetical protein B0H14DRAFT_2646624 [Mycena olivaceomarginata]|nr:hypothetical protein B0H14DRAFT_2646624 [Mycena olivaceomarginata]
MSVDGVGSSTEDTGHQTVPSTPVARPSGHKHSHSLMSVDTPLHTPTTFTEASVMPGTPLPGLLAKAQLHSGYEVALKVLSYRPYSLNSPGIRKQAPAVLSNPGQLNKIQALDPEEWNRLAVHHKLIPAGATLHSFQISVSNRVLMQLGDAVVITPTGSGKSLTWVLPLLARGEGVSLVITPFTSLGLEGELLYQNGDLNTIYIYSERNTATDFELVQEGIFANVLDLVHHKMHQPTEYLERGEAVESMLRSINQALILGRTLPSCCQAVTQQEIVASLKAGCWNLQDIPEVMLHDKHIAPS